MNSLSEIIEADLDISTLYQLVVSLILAKQGSIIIRAVKAILRKISFIENLKMIQQKKLTPTKQLAFSIESVYDYIHNKEELSNELAEIFDHYEFTESLVRILV